MNYDETINYMYSQLPMFSRIGQAAYKNDLHNSIALCDFLGAPQTQFRSVHIAGTNGKGSTSHMLAAILQQAGYKTGLYTSPHIKDFRERIRINGKMVDKEFVINFIERTRGITEAISPSFFELTVAMAFDFFAKEKVDIAVVETGLGGRLDSTNIITPEVAIITNIGYDHINLLGTTLKEIAGEKAGIIKSNIPVIIGEANEETLPVFMEKATSEQAPLFLANECYEVSAVVTSAPMLPCKAINLKNGITEEYELDLPGFYQAKNLSAVLTAVDLLNEKGFHINRSNIHIALQQVKKSTGLLGRWDIIQNDPALIVDVAHNEDGISQVLKQLRTVYPNAVYHFVLGFVNDKDIRPLLALFPENGIYYFTNAHIPRAMAYENLVKLAADAGLTGNGYDDVNTALSAAISKAATTDVIVLCGSFFIIAEIY